ncbi:hypothetical protein CIB93_26580 [Streptomyces sp. WZ.A104]|uniref:hypothetical protein n=1 Tax=Streptomyces sp. WZ.A104 TaxID=2023771 RepID=UPI000BBC0DC1|nr:hypothetical protein [Streptomyces sp. WZ.A104]PCG83101.1 hypothetical protein CIB93_26580 [Streptomyces sp. WZ.A104]
MPKESQEAKRTRKAAAKAAARARAARITAGEIPDYLKRPAPEPTGPWLLQPQHTIVHAPEPRAKALIPPSNAPLRPRDREQYADNAPPVWVKEDRCAEND